ncbi:MAG: 4'-phosphopantetheinyl transferase superfamily protein [Bacteroidia bacterium]|nr:4'-phosphopantetheinyl transferase superfamily protein [Bacteroidia bacterium]
MDKRVLILFSRITQPFSPEKWQELLALVPAQQQEKILRYHRWQDRHLGLVGKLLLREGLLAFDLSPELTEKMTFNAWDRPEIPGDMDFNLSHSGEMVVCALSRAGRVGIDVEQIQQIDFRDFQKQMTESQWEDIRSGEHLLGKFFQYWTLKEAVIKLDGRGLSLPLMQLETDFRRAWLGQQSWPVFSIDLGNGDYPAHLATDFENPAIELREIIPEYW